MEATRLVPKGGAADGDWERERFAHYREWLARNWGVGLETLGARRYERFDPRVRWTDPFRTIGRPEVILADLPQKPVVGARYPLNEDGGPQGISLLLPFIEEAARRLGPNGRLYFFLHTLPHPEAILRLHRRYDVRLVSWMWQIFNRMTLREIHRYLVSRRRRRLCYFVDLPDGRFAFPCMIFSAVPRH